jgi:hypothetical protein
MGVYSRETTDVEFSDERVGETRAVEAGGMAISFERLKAGFTTVPLAKGLPGDACICEHWGFLLSGRFRILRPEGEEVVEAGRAYFMEPGHNIIVDEDVDLVEITPAEARHRVGEHFMANAAALIG